MSKKSATGLRGNLVYFLRKKTLHYRETKPVVFACSCSADQW